VGPEGEDLPVPELAGAAYGWNPVIPGLYPAGV